MNGDEYKFLVLVVEEEIENEVTLFQVCRPKVMLVTKM